MGVILFIVTLVLGFTGYLLPWDMNAYFASQVAINIAASAPFLGAVMQQFLRAAPASERSRSIASSASTSG